MDKESIFFTLFFGWYLCNFGPPSNLLILFHFLYIKSVAFYERTIEVNRFLKLFFDYYNLITSPDFFAINETEENNDENNDENKENNNEATSDAIIYDKKEIKYEDKYLEEIKKLDKEFIFTSEEEELKEKKYLEIYKEQLSSYSTRILEIQKEFKEQERILSKCEGTNDYCICDEEDEDINLDTNKYEIENIKEEQTKLFKEMDTLKQILETEEGKEKCMNESLEKANEFIIKQRLDKLKNCYIIENTPLGNVLMLYDNERGTFKFYSDSTIPYRYLETVGRKYVKQFNCRPIFVDMEEEIRLAEDRWEKDRKEKEEKEENEKRKNEENIKNNLPVQEKKNVFAKFKSYNKEAGTGHVNISAPPKNSIPNKLTEKQENEKVILKEKANRYTYEGKFANFNFLKKIERKVTDKKYALSFADFKKLQKDKK
jgi:hypothetical protein